MTFDHVRARYCPCGSFPPDLPKPSRNELDALVVQFKRSYPPSFVAFQLRECGSTPMAPRDWDGFGWANPELEPYMSLRSVLECAEESRVPSHLSPFRHDEGNFFCFDTSRPDSTQEYPVVFWDHDERGVLNVPHYQWPTFLEWLASGLEGCVRK